LAGTAHGTPLQVMLFGSEGPPSVIPLSIGGLASIMGGHGSGRISGQLQTLAEHVHDEGVSFLPPKQSV
jgi:hypothetical protein